MGNENKGSIAVIGAGMSGLTASWFLEKKGYDVTVFEKNDRVGGQIYSVVIGDESVSVNDYDGENSCEMIGGGFASELGAVSPPFRNGLLDVADELSVEYEKAGADFLLKTERGKEVVDAFNYPLCKATFNPLRYLIERALYCRIFRQYPELTSSPGLYNHDSDLMLPMMEFAQKKGIVRWAEIYRALFVPFGYGYFENVPAAYFLHQMALFDTKVQSYVFPCGLQSFLQKIADSITKVNLNTEIKDINRFENGTVEVIADDGTIEHFDKLVLASGLYNAPSIMDVGEEENELFTRVNTIKYLTSYVIGKFTDHSNVPLPRGRFGFIHIEENAVPTRIDHLNMYGLSERGAANAWQILADDTTVEEATEILKQDLLDEAELEDIIVQRQELWPNYFPTVSSEDCLDGFHDRVEALQGVRNTYYLDPSLSFHTTTSVFEFAKDLVDRKL